MVVKNQKVKNKKFNFKSIKQIYIMNSCKNFDSDNHDDAHPVKRMGGKSASARSKPLSQKALDCWLEKFYVDRENWERGDLNNEELSEVPPYFPDGLEMLFLGGNKIKDVSGLCLPNSLEMLWLDVNQIRDVSGLCLPDGLITLYLSNNLIEDVSGLRLPDGLQIVCLDENQIPKEKRSYLKVPDDCTVVW